MLLILRSLQRLLLFDVGITDICPGILKQYTHKVPHPESHQNSKSAEVGSSDLF
jgi:hypothetical protein